jgi:hypothetical protein
MAKYPEQVPLAAKAQGDKVRPVSRAFVVRDEPKGKAFITLCSFFLNKNGNLSGKASLRCKHADGTLEEMTEFTLKKDEFVNLSDVK